MALLSPSQLNPQIQKALKISGLDPGPVNPANLANPANLRADFEITLAKSGLDAPTVLKQVGELMVYAEQENTRLAAAKIGLQLNKLLDSDEAKIGPPIVNIIIQDSEYINLNPILLPR